MGTKTVFITIAGRANAGKSSLLNALIGEKIAMVSDKPQTTRTKITGILTKDSCQYVFIDTPGIHKAQNRLGEHMVRNVKEAISEMDVILMVADVSRPINEGEQILLQNFRHSHARVILVLNKIDLISKEQLLSVIAKYASLYEFESILPVSVLQGDGIDLVLDEVTKFASDSPFHFPESSFTDQSERALTAEMIREKLLLLLSDEVPHGIAVVVESMKERDNQEGETILDIISNIYCERESHKGIVIGKNGTMLKRVGTLARKDLESFFEIRVNLKLWVKAKPDWRNKEGSIQSFGLS